MFALLYMLCFLSIYKANAKAAFSKQSDYYIESSVTTVPGLYQFDRTLYEASGIGQYIFKHVDANIYLYQVINVEQERLTDSWQVGSDYDLATNPLLSCGYASSSSSSSSNSNSGRRRARVRARSRRRALLSNSRSSKGSARSGSSDSDGTRHSCRSANARWFLSDSSRDKDFRIRKTAPNVQKVKKLQLKDICVSYVSTAPGASYDFVGAYHSLSGQTVTMDPEEWWQEEFFPGVVWVKVSSTPAQFIYFLGSTVHAEVYMDTDTNVANGYEYSCDLGDGFDHYSLPEITDCPLDQWLSSVTGQFDEDMITTHCGADVYTDSICVEDKKESETNSASDGVYQYKREESGIWTGPKYEKLDGTRFIYPYEYTASGNELVGWGIWDNAAQTGEAIWQCGFKKLALPETTPFISNIFDDCDTNDWNHWDGTTRITNSQLKIVRCPTTKKVN